MLQQTPVVRVIPRLAEWLERWPTPALLAAEPSGEAVRAWHRLGYPRRALRLHAAAVAITERHDGVVPSDVDDLLALPGVGDYTARAVAVFAYGERHPVVDTNVRRVIARAIEGVARSRVRRPPAGISPRWRSLLPDDRDEAARLQRRADGARGRGLHRARAAVRRMPDRADLSVGGAPASPPSRAYGRRCRRASRARTVRFAASS